jgi:hypothetical protein
MTRLPFHQFLFPDAINADPEAGRGVIAALFILTEPTAVAIKIAEWHRPQICE